MLLTLGLGSHHQQKYSNNLYFSSEESGLVRDPSVLSCICVEAGKILELIQNLEKHILYTFIFLKKSYLLIYDTFNALYYSAMIKNCY